MTEISERSPQLPDRGFDLSATIAIAWRERVTVLIVALLTVALVVVYLNVATYYYTATLKVTAAQSSPDGLFSKLGNVAGLSALTGGRLSAGGGSSTFLNYGENLQSRSAAQQLACDPVLLRGMFPREWDPDLRRWREPASGFDSLLNGIRSILGLRVYSWQQPDAGRVQDFLERRVNVTQDQRKPIITVTFDDPDAKFAVHLLERLHKVVDDDIRQRSLERAEANVQFLIEQLRIVTLADHRQALADALSEQEKTRMLARSSASFAAEPLSDASASLRPTSPRPMLLLIGGLVGGLGIGVLAAIGVDRLRAPRTVRPVRTREIAELGTE